MVQEPEKEMAQAQGPKWWPLSVEAYHVLGEAGVIPENTELLYGRIFTKMPNSPLHTFLLYFLIPLLQNLGLPNLWVRSEQSLRLVDSQPQPDISIVKGARTDYRTGHPTTAELVIEICVTSHEYDRWKLRAYAQAQVKECWLVLAPERQIEVYSEPKDGAYGKKETIGPGGILRSCAVPGVAVELEQLFAETEKGN